MGHSHDSGAADSMVGEQLRRLLWLVVGIVSVGTLGAMILLWPSESLPVTPVGEQVAGEVLELGQCKPPADECIEATVRVDEGPQAGQQVKSDIFQDATSPQIDIGTAVWLVENEPGSGQYSLSEINRQPAIVWLLVIFSVAVVVFARWKGLAALAGLVSSMALLIWFVLPSLLLGKDPVVVAAVGAAAIAIVAMLFAHGLHVGTAVAIVSTVIALILTLALAWIFTGFVNLSGLGNEGSYFLNLQGMDFDIRGLFLAGVVIGALGVLDDVTITQAATVAEVKRADPSANWSQLFGAGMRVGRDHVAATVNTLVLAYVGAALPTFILLTMSDAGLLQSISNEVVAQEVVRALIGGLGIIGAVPITTALMAATLASGDGDEVTADHDDGADGHSSFWDAK
ncbi:MAG: YibE/F family protein [Micrococcales bacterium]|nr:YibE/F family protein [Micrococcales bacterium]